VVQKQCLLVLPLLALPLLALQLLVQLLALQLLALPLLKHLLDAPPVAVAPLCLSSAP